MISNRTVIIVSDEDLAGLNMLDFILDHLNPKEQQFTKPSNWPDGQYQLWVKDDISMLKIPDSQIKTDYFSGIVRADLLIFASKHSSAAGQKALLVHTTGIWQKEEGHGGNDHEVAFAPANILRYAYDRIKQLEESRDIDYWTGIECTHHGPSSLDIPIMYIETGGTIDEWQDQKACYLIAEVILDTIEAIRTDRIPQRTAFIGIGGNHYCSRFIKILDERNLSLGHVIPKYALSDLPIEMIEQAWNKTIAQDKIILIDKKGCRAEDRDRIIEYANNKGYPWEFA